MPKTILSKTFALTMNEFSSLIAPLLRRGFESSSSEMLRLNKVKDSPTQYFIIVQSDSRNQALAELRRELDEITTQLKPLIEAEDANVVTGMGIPPLDPPGFPGHRWDSAAVSAGNPPVDRPPADRKETELDATVVEISPEELENLRRKEKSLRTKIETFKTPTSGIEVFQQLKRHILIEFIDGYSPESPYDRNLLPIGDAFTELAGRVIQMVSQSPDLTIEQAPPPSPSTEDPIGGKYGTHRDLTITDTSVLLDREHMRKHYKDYSSATAKKIIDALPKAHDRAEFNLQPWRPKVLANYVSLTPTTTGRYLNAFRQEGFSEINDTPLPK